MIKAVPQYPQHMESAGKKLSFEKGGIVSKKHIDLRTCRSKITGFNNYVIITLKK